MISFLPWLHFAQILMPLSLKDLHLMMLIFNLTTAHFTS